MKGRAKIPVLFTIGYEKATQPALIGELKGAGVDLVVDTRAVSASRRPGFSKRQLAAALDDAGIAYLHLQKLGTPAQGREAARSGNLPKLWKIYEKHLSTPDAREALDELFAIVRSGRRVCLLCYERDVQECHRLRLAELVSDGLGAKARHLVPPLF
jgi:uncharacterized protein (DUF488 family)